MEKQGKIIEEKVVSVDMYVGRCLRDIYCVPLPCAAVCDRSCAKPRAEGTHSKALWAVLWGEAPNVQAGAAGESCKVSKDCSSPRKSRVTEPQPSCRDSRKAFPEVMWYNLLTRGGTEMLQSLQKQSFFFNCLPLSLSLKATSFKT